MNVHLAKKCLSCGAELPSRYSKSRQYCSNQCQHEYQYVQYIKIWKAGLVSGLRGKYALSRHVVRYVHEKYGNKCAKCRWCRKNPVTKKSPLEIDHIDGNYANCSEKNLMLLCPNCHSLTPTYKKLNHGYGRRGR